MEVRVRVPGPLRGLVGGASTVTVEVAADGPPAGGSVSVEAVLDALALAHPALERRVRDERGRVRPHVNLFVGADNVRDRDGMTTMVAPDSELTILPAISGGSSIRP